MMPATTHFESAPGGRHRTLDRMLIRAAVGTLLACSLNTAAADAIARDLVPVTMMIGFSSAAFLQSNRNDVEAAFKALAETIGRKRGFLVTVKTRFFSDAPAFFAAIDAGEINFAIFDSLTYVSERRRGDLTPIFIAANEGTPGRHYLVLVRRDSGLRTLEALRGKSIVELQAPNLSVGHTWLLNLLLAQRVESHEAFFRSIEQVARPSAAVLPVFFGRQDACLVDDLGFKLMEELNPQVGAQLRAVATSVPLVGAVVCASESSWAAREFRPVLLQALSELHLEPAGRQILTLFKIDQLLPYEEAQLDTIRELWSSYTKLRQEARP